MTCARPLARWGNEFQIRKPEHFVFPWCESRHLDATRPTNRWRTAWRTITRAIECAKWGQVQRPTDSCRNPECKADLRAGKIPLAKLRLHDLRHTAITKLSEGQASDQTIMSIAGHVSRQMLEHYWHIRLAAKRTPWIRLQLRCPLLPAGNRQFFRVMCTKMVTKTE